MKFELGSRNTIVIKIGSALLVESGKIRDQWLKSIAADISQLVSNNIKVIIVSSGSVALGKKFLKFKSKKLSLEEKQAAAAVGQIKLMGFYDAFFKEYNLEVAQILLTVPDCNNRKRYLNSKNTIETLIKNNIIPVINENDTIAVDEIKIGDNDRLAARVSQMVSADLLVLFSDIDGLYDKNPKIHDDATFIHTVNKITKDIVAMASGPSTSLGTGGMNTKIEAAKMAATSSCDTIITNGLPDNPLRQLLDGKKNYTIFHGKKSNTKPRKEWLAGFFNTKGEVVVNTLARETLLTKKISLLPVGVIKVTGKFEKGDAIFVKDKDNNHIASGISSYCSKDLRKIIGKNSKEIKKLLGENSKTELIHIDDLVVCHSQI